MHWLRLIHDQKENSRINYVYNYIEFVFKTLEWIESTLIEAHYSTSQRLSFSNWVNCSKLYALLKLLSIDI